ncbi:right-handed parallel beta-helix repeat-containing protein [Geminisphaera colitermitum]|uniref:right-handed parallel beta-helix repeat-containing protein n=1 Tax=Geminisphaera colitermitum TaxID=1148786 RepID=UPI000158CD3D|nr:right-handed parallel beta-helix repeat-containing protein [Geminisphaera colitermitum]
MRIPRLYSIALTLLLPLTTFAAVHHVPPGPAEAITRAIAAAAPGDIIQLQPGTYHGTVRVTRSGEPERPLIIAGIASGTTTKPVIDGGAEPGSRKRNQAFAFENVSWVTLQDVEIRNAWTDAITINDSSYISILRCDILETGQHAISARGDRSHHILIDACKWTQDTRVYTTWDWAELHHGVFKHYNGGIYGGGAAAGGAVIRHNNAGYGFNGLRWWLGEATGAQARHQSNIEIYDNHFHHFRDNVIEPENFTWNLHVYHNRLDSCPRGVFSIDGVAGGEIYIYGNTGRWDQDGATEVRAWTVYKFADYNKKETLNYPLHIYHNSFAYGAAFARGSKVRKADDHLRHFNNAYTHQGDSHLGLIEWPGQDCQFDHDISSAPFQPDVSAAGYETHGIAATDPKFVDPARNDYRTAPDSAARDAGKIIDGFTLWHTGRAPDAGAYDGDQPVYGPPFLYREPPGGALYKERPRIVRIFARDTTLAVFFSTPLEPASLTPKTIQLKAGTTPLTVRSARFPLADQTQAVLLELDALPADATQLDITFATLPRGLNGESGTMWAADTRVVRIPANATLTGLMARLF